MKLRKGDIVGRISYGKDIAFVISDFVELKDKKIAILKGVALRIEADSPINDLEILNENEIKKLISDIEYKINKPNPLVFKRYREYYGTILHLDGDKTYGEKSQRFYRNLGLSVVVKNIPENKQPHMIISLLNKYNPDILVVTRT